MPRRFEPHYRRFGLLPLLCFASLLVAAVFHHLSRLPGPYTWFEPVWTLRSVLGEARFPVALLAVYGLGSWARRGDWDVLGMARLLAQQMTARDCASLLLPRALSAVAVLTADAVLLDTRRDPLDLVALTAFGICIGGQRPPLARLARELGFALLSSLIALVTCYCFTVSKALIFVDGRGFDAAIIGLEMSLFGFVPHRVLATWAATEPRVVALCDWVYFHFFEHMALTTVLLVTLRKRAERSEYLAALALCYLIGGLGYHLYPAQGPSYFEPQYFGFLQRPSLITRPVRAWLKYNTDTALHCTASTLRTWSYIACMPSLHVAHELVMLYYSRHSLPAFLLSAAFTLLTLLSVVVLGWHYPLDFLGGAAVALAAIAIARWQRRTLMPAYLDLGEDSARLPPKPLLSPFLLAYRAERRMRAARKH